MSAPNDNPDKTKPSVSDEYLSVDDVAHILKIDRCTVARRFQDFPGVIDVGSQGICWKRKHYRVLRIPQSALQRFINSRRVA